MRLFSFQGLHYAWEAADLPAGELAAPPYDQIDDQMRDELHAVSPHQFTHLTRPVAEDDVDEYRHAAELHDEWLAEGVVARDATPSIYPYAIEFPDGALRLGIAALIGLEPPDSAAIRPHERTLAKPLADRLKLLETMRVDLEPALFVSDDAGELDQLLHRDVAELPALVTHLDENGYRHVLYRLEDPRRIALYRDVLARADGAIADGHHRYKVAQEFAKHHSPAAGTAAAAKLAVVTSLDSPALTIDPIHRALADTPDLSPLHALIVQRTRPELPAEAIGTALAAAVAAEPQPAVGVLLPDGSAEIWRLDPERAPDHLSAGARRLSVVLLHEVLFAGLGLTEESWTDGTVLYRSDAAKLHRLVTGGQAGIGFFLPPMEPPVFAAAIAEGDLLPPKSTRFLPKVVSGLVWADHASELGEPEE